MKRVYLIKMLPAFIVLVFLPGLLHAQLVSCNAFLKGNYVEVGINTNGAFGTGEPAPGGYHPRGGVSMKNVCTGGCSGTLGLGWVADPDKDGWTVGTPNYYGDYFLPGTPQEGWSIEVNGAQSNAWNNNAGCATGTIFTGTLSGNNVLYSNNGTRSTSTWVGANSTFSIRQITTLDTGNLFFTMSVTLVNTSGSTQNNVYYMRTVDPDQEVPITGLYQTINEITYQLPNALNATLVSATGTTHPGAYLGLGTLDCRAKCFRLNSGLVPTVNCSALYAGSSTVSYSGTATIDAGVGIVFNLGNVAAGDSVKFAYAYILDTSDIINAFKSTLPDWTATGDTATAHVAGDTASVCMSTLTTASITNPGTFSWSWTALTGETLSTYTGPSTQVMTSSTIIQLMAIGIDACTGLIDTLYLNLNPVKPTPANPTASSSSPVCEGSTLNLSSSTTTSGVTYSWSGPGGFISGVQNPTITGVALSAAGTYSVTALLSGCPSSLPGTTTVTVNPLPAAITGTPTVCIGYTTTLADATGGGTWISAATGVASVGSTTGIVTGISAGTSTISYRLTATGCAATTVVTVNALPAAIGGTRTVCVGNTTTLTDATTGGTWTSSNIAIATIGSTSGVVTGVAAGTSTITYTAGGCYVIAVVTVNASPAAISPPGGSIICIGTTLSLTDATPGGIWSSNNTGVATVGSGSGVVTGAGIGTATISYTVAGCPATKPVTVIAAPPAISPLSSTVCVGANSTLTNSSPGGTWTSSNGSVATVGATSGIVTGLATGSVTITYTTGTCFVTATVTVNPNPSAISPVTASMCVGATTTLSDATPGGSWSSGNTSVATVGSTGVVTGVASGTATISYTVAGCSATRDVTVLVTPAAISPTSSTVCVGSAVILTNTVVGGTWASSNPAIAAVGSSTGTVTGVATGNVTITYALGTCSVTATVTVDPTPSAISPSTPVILCVGNTASLSDPTPGGTWSSTNTSVATVNTSGVVTAVSSGTSDISYTNSFGCAAVKTITVSVTPATITPSSASVCVGSTIGLTNSVSGGAWTSGNSSIASIGSGTGIVTGVAAGNTNITYAIGSCIVTSTVTVTPLPSAGTITGPTSVCIGSNITLTTTATGGFWTSSNTAVGTVGLFTGIVSGVSGGTVTISYSVTGLCGTVSSLYTVNVIPPGVTAIVGPSAVCAGTFANYTNATTGGTWSVTNANATINSAGLLTGITPGLDTIRYTVTNACGTSVATMTVNIGPFLSAGTISGPGTVCVGATITMTDPVPGGTWSSSNTSIATVGTSGIVTGVGGGIDTIRYTLTASCGSAVATKVITVNPLADAGTITGPSDICVGAIVIYTSTVTGGVWGLTNTTIAAISGSGVVSAFGTGLDTIRYTVTTSCGTAVTTKTVNIGAAPTAGTITGPSSVCTGATITLANATTGGVWSSSNTAVASVGSTGIVTGVATGTVTISYTVTNSCGTAVATKALTVNPSPDAGIITGPTSICTGTTTLYITSGTGGAWSFSNSNATVTSGGSVTAVTAGMDTLIYTVTNSCGTATSTLAISIGSSASVTPVTGAAAVCIGSTITLMNATSGGTWSSSNTSAATITSGGVVSGVGTGTTVISYVVTSSCGTATATHTVNVSPAPVVGAISGPSIMCVSVSALFTNPVAGGTWSSSTPSVASVAGTGLVNAVGAGSATISYTITNACGSITATTAVAVAVGASPGTITGPSGVCVGSTIALSNSAAGGVWSSTNPAIATVGSTGIVSGLTAGTDTIMYSVTSSCGTLSTMHIVNVSASGISAIAGPSSVCVGSLILLTNASPGGAWSASNGNATITTGGLVTGILPGIDTISYTISGACGLAAVTKVITVNLLPTVGAISGPSSVCVSASITLTNTISGGVWSRTNTTATVGSSTGIVTGVSAGVDTIIYTVTTACGSLSTSTVIAVNPLPVAGVLSGPDSVCIGSAITLTNSVGGGVWSAGNANATVSGAGVVTGISGGTTPISYSVTNGCGTASAVKIITIVSFPASGAITGSSAVCVGSGITLTATAPGGTWSASNGNAIIAGPGIVQGVTVGIDTIFYTVMNMCGTSVSSKVVTINPVPVVSPITGPTNHCVGTSVTLSSTTTGGIWTSSTPAVATIGLSSGIVLGVSAGTTTITYTVTNSFGCPTSVIARDTVNVIPSLPPISGSANVCVGSAATLADSVGGGTWSSSNPAVATIGAASGIVTGMTVGTTTITYSITNSCGTSSVTMSLTVNPLPSVAPITGITHQCTGASTTLSNATTGGIWISSNPSVATIGSSSGVVAGVTVGTTTINYVYTGAFGCTSVVSTQDTVVASPTVAGITGVTNHCVGTSTTLSNATPGGTWSSAVPAVATVGATTGIVMGVSSGTALINYSVTNGAGCTTTVGILDTVITVPGVDTIAGPATVCPGATITLTNSTAGGAWSMTTGNATITSGGGVTGVTTGIDTAVYTVTNACGTTAVTKELIILPLPSASAITGATNVCAGTTTTLSSATTGGVWSASNGNATVSSSGMVTGVAPGIDTIMYTVTTACGSATATTVITIGTLPIVDAITGPSTVCRGATITLADITPGGIWTTTTAKVLVSSTGVVTGVTAGVDTVRYIVTNACGSSVVTKVVTVMQPPIAGTISGPASVCPGFTITLSATGATAGGTWTSSNTAKATVMGGVVTGVTPGTAIITYTVSNSCGTRSASRSVTVLTPADCNGHTKVNNVSVAESIRIFPNPAISVLNIESPVSVNIAIVSVDGKILIEQAGASVIDISSLANGIYLLKIYDDQNGLIKTDKFVKMQ